MELQPEWARGLLNLSYAHEAVNDPSAAMEAAQKALDLEIGIDEHVVKQRIKS